MMSTIKSDIPPEIIFSILDHVPSVETLRLLRTVSKTFLHLINPRLFSKITLFFKSIENLDKQLWLITSPSTVCSFVKAVREVTLNSTPDTWENDYIIPSRGGAPKAVIYEDLAPFLATLQNLETVNWILHIDEEPALYLATIARSLSSLAKLRDVAITVDSVYDIDDDFTPLQTYMLPPLHTFKNLSSLSLSCFDDLPTAYCNQEIARAIAASPQLARFSLRNQVILKDDIPFTVTCTSLQTLFGNSISPQLIQLELRDVPTPAAGLRELLSPRLKSLTVSPPPGPRPLNFAWAELFNILEEAGIELSQLSITDIDAGIDEIFSYLISYAGCLQILEIRDIRMDCQNREESAGCRFWDQIVPHHKDSLAELTVMPSCEGAWCYGPMFAAAIQQCLLLRKLTISVRRVDSAWAEAKLSLASANNGAKYLYLGKPYGLPENSAALILNDFSQPLAQLTLMLSNENRTPTDYWNPPEIRRRGRISKNLDRLILGVRATSRASGDVSSKWPLKLLVAGNHYALQLRRSVENDVGGEDDGDKWLYKRVRAKNVGDKE